MTNIPIYIHFGAPKTATSTLQEHVFMTAPRVLYRGRPQTDGDVGRFNHAVLHTQSDHKARDVVARFYDMLADEAVQAGKDRVVISNENFLSTHLWKILAERLVLSGYDVTLLLTIRSQFTLVESYFASHARTLKYVPAPYNGRAVRFDDWWRFNFEFPTRSLFRILHYADVIDTIRECRPVPLIVLAYEDMVAGSDRYLSPITSITGLDSEEIKRRLSLRANPRDSRRSVAYSTWRQKFLPGVKFSNLPGAKPIVNYADNFLRRGKPVTPMIGKSHRDIINNMFADGNRRIAATFDLPLEKLGYPWRNE